MKRKISVKSDYAFGVIIKEFLIICVLALVLFLIEGEFTVASLISRIRVSVFTISLASCSLLGIEVFSSLVRFRWRFKLANEEYPIVLGFILIILNGVICLLALNRERGCFILIIPCVTWIMQIIISTIYRWLH